MVTPGRWWIFAARVDLDGFARIIRSPGRRADLGAGNQNGRLGLPATPAPFRDGRLLMTYGYRRPPRGVADASARTTARHGT